jgi:hypothetical protein
MSLRVLPIQHRVLLFCQLKSFLDIIENDLFANAPGISYLRLDGTIIIHMRIVSGVLYLNTEPLDISIVFNRVNVAVGLQEMLNPLVVRASCAVSMQIQ